MMIDWANFTPWTSLLGGVLIGVAIALFILFNGRIAGISGIVSGLLRFQRGDIYWRITFIMGMLGAPWVYTIIAPLPAIEIDADFITLIIAGLLVGIGTSYGSGCTSGHGVCGISRLSPRSIVATLTFMGSGFMTVYIVRHIFGV